MANYRITTYALELARNFGYLYPYEVFTLQSIAKSLPEGSCVINIGAGSGTSSLAMVEANPGIKIWTIDISSGGPLGGFENERNAFAGTKLNLPYQVLGDSKEIGKRWPIFDGPEKLDLIFVDGDHNFDGIRGDILSWKPHIKKGGLMLFHDYGREDWPDVKTVVDDLMADSFPIIHVDTLKVFRC